MDCKICDILGGVKGRRISEAVGKRSFLGGGELAVCYTHLTAADLPSVRAQAAANAANGY